MIFLMLLNADLRQIRKLGSKVIFAFLASSLSIAVAFVLAYSLFLPMMNAESWKTFAALSGSWMGGTGNMAAIQMALDVPDSSMGYTLLIDSIDYAIWVMLLLALVPFAKKFDNWVGTDTSKLDEVAEALSEQKQEIVGDQTTSLLFLLGLSLLVSITTQYLATTLPTSVFFTTTTWTVILVTIIGVSAALTPLSRLFGATELSNIMLFLIVSLIASRADFAELTQAPLYILMGLSILLFHSKTILINLLYLKLTTKHHY